MSQEECPILRWGDIIRIHGVNLTKKNQIKGLIISKGFTDSSIYYQRYQDFSEVNFYRQSLFQILPRSNFDMHDQLQDQTLQPAQRQSIKSRAVAQIIGLQNNLKLKAGQQIKYGNQVIFRHVESQSYLRGILKAADTGQGAFKVEVASSLSSDVIFKLTSHRSYQRDDDKIYYDDPLQIYHIKADCYTNFVESDDPIFIDNYLKKSQLEQGHEFKKFVEKRPLIKKPHQFRVPVINQNKSKCLWKFVQHCSYDEFNEKKKIKSHDIVYFQHTKKRGQVASSLSQPITYYLKQTANAALSYDCFWELIPKQIKQTEPEDWSCFKARNIITGKQLTFNDVCVEIKPDNENSKEFINEGRVSLQISEHEKLQRGKEMPIVENQQKIIQFYESKVSKINFKGVHKMTEDILLIFKVKEEMIMDIQYAISSLEPLVKLVEILTESFKDQNNEDFKYIDTFMDLDEDFLLNIILIIKMLTGKIYSTTYDNIFASGNTPNQSFQKILVQTGIAGILIEIINLFYKPIKFIIANEHQPSSDRAIRNKIGQIFEFTYKLLQKIAVGFEENRIFISRWVDVFLEHSNNINKSYIQQTLVGILHNNPVSIEATINEKKIVNLIESFFAEAKGQSVSLTTKYLRLFSTFIKCQNRILKQNQNIILNHFFKNLDNEYSFKFKIEMKPEYEPEQVKGVFEKALGRQVHISFGKQQFTTIPKFYRDWRPKWDYFMFFVNLLADISMDRNKDSIHDVGILLPLQTIAVILFDPDIRKLNKEIAEDIIKEQQNGKGQSKGIISNVHEPFLRVAHYVYINNDNFSPIKRIKKISQWHKEKKVREEYDKYGQKQIIQIPENINISKRQFNGEKEEQERSYLLSILTYIKQFLKCCDQNTINLAILLTILNLIKETIVLGLWNSIEHFRQIIPIIVMRIARIQKQTLFYADEETTQKKTPEQIVKLNKSHLLLNRPQVAMNIDCKIQATEIIRLMNELQIDIRLRYIMKFFKGMYETTINFNEIIENEQDKKEQPQLQIKGEEQTQEDEQKRLRIQEEKERNQIAKEAFHKKQGKDILGGIKKVSEDQQVILKDDVWKKMLKNMTPFTYIKKNKGQSSDRYLFQGVPEDDTSQEHFQIQFKKIVLSFFELSAFQNERMMNSSLIMLRTMFQQRKDLLDYFKAILICGKGNLNEVYVTLKFMREKFDMLNNFNIKNYHGDHDNKFSFAFWKPYDNTEKKRQQKSGIIQDLFFLTRTLKQNMSLKNIESLMNVDLEVFNFEQVYKYMDQKQENNQLFQAVNLAQGIYYPLICYLRIMKNEEKLPEIHRRLICSIFQYLTLLCFNFLEAKQILMEYISDLLPYLSKKVGAASFICEICKNNKILVSNEDIVSEIIEVSLESCLNLDRNELLEAMIFTELDRDANQVQNNDYEKSLIFHSLRGLLIFNDQGFHRNQQILMNRLQDSKFRRLIFKRKFEFREKLNNFNLSPEEAYIANHFQLFSFLVESKNLVNIGKLENIHPYTYCLECLKNTNRWQLRRSLRAYINRLYYVNKQKDLFLFEEFIRKQFDIINCELSDLVELHKYKMISDQIMIKNGIRFVYAQSQILMVMLEIFISIQEMFLKPEFIKILKKELAKEEKYNDTNRILHEKIIRLFKYIGCLNKLYPSTKNISPFIKELKRILVITINNMQQKYLAKKSEPDGDFGEKPEMEDQIGKQVQKKKSYVYDHSKSFFRNLSIMIREIKAENRLADLIKDHREQGCVNHVESIFSVPNEKLKPLHEKKEKKAPAHENPHLQTTTSKIFKVLAKPQLNENEENITLNKRLLTVKNLLQEKPIFDKLKEDEFYKIVEIFIKLDETSKIFYQDSWKSYNQKSIPVINVQEIIKNIFQLVQNYPDQIKDSEKIFFIKIVRCYITQAVEANQYYKLPIDQWQSDYLGQNKESFIERQNVIEKCGGSEFILSIFKENLTTRIQLLNEALLLGIAYLFGGNTNCQDSILRVLINDRENLMILSFRTMIKKIGEFFIDVRRMQQSEGSRKFAFNIVDTHDYYNSEDHALIKFFNQKKVDKFQVQIQVLSEYALCRMFRFLQLFGQNNNIPMKKFLTKQVNDDEEKKINSINFIEEGCLILRNLFKIMNNRTVNVPQYILAFIGQISQVPCIDNQISFMKSTYFEDVSYMSTFFQDENNLLFRKFSEDNQKEQLFKIYEDSINIALSNFEGRDQILVSQFLNKCHPRFLWMFIKKNLEDLLSDEEKNYPNLLEIPEKQTHDKSLQSIIENEKKIGQKYEGPIISIINVLTLLKHISDWIGMKETSAANDLQNPDNEDKKQAQKGSKFLQNFETLAVEEYMYAKQFLNYFNENLIIQIEVSSDNGKSVDFQYIYFPFHPIFHYLAPETKNSIMMNVDRGTQRDKLLSLLQFREDVYTQIKWNYELNYFQTEIFGYQIKHEITSKLCQKIRGYALKCSYLICLLLILFIYVDHDPEQKTSIFVFDSYLTYLPIRALCLIQLGLTLLYCGLWGKMRATLAIVKYTNMYKQKEEQGENKQDKQKELMQEEKEDQEGWIAVSKKLVAYYSIFSRKVSSFKKYVFKTNFYSNYLLPIIAIAQTESGFYSLAIFVIASLLGNFYGVQWYTVHLFDFFLNIPMLSNVFKAIFMNIKELATLSLLATAFIVVFNVLSFSTYTVVVYEDEVPEQACTDILDCILALYTSGTINGDMEEFHLSRFIFDISYVVFMELLFGSLVGGIMIDGFASLRQQDTQRDADKLGQCYVCSKTKANMQKDGQTFPRHTYGHFLWYYLYYIQILQNKDETDLTGIQSEIRKQIDSQEVLWFPSKGQDDGGDEIKNKLNELSQKVSSLGSINKKILEKGLNAIEIGKKSVKKKIQNHKELPEMPLQE